MFSRAAAIWIAILVAAVAFSLFHVQAENTIYFWDTGNFFRMYQDHGARLQALEWGWVRDIVESIRSSDYNAAPVAPLVPFYALFGGGRATYIALIVGLYLVPAAILAALLTQSAINKGQLAPAEVPGWTLVAAVLYWPFWIETLRGLPDVAGLLPLGAATMLLLRPDLLRSKPVLYGLLNGGLIWISFVLRRWYAYPALALLATSGAATLWILYKEKAQRADNLRRAALFLGTCGATVLLLLLLQLPLVERVLHTPYTRAYSSFQGPLSLHFLHVFNQAGPFLAALMALGVIRAAKMRQWRILFLLACTAVSFAMFSRMHVPEIHHMLPWFLWMFPAFVNGVMWMVELCRRPAASWLAPVFMSVCFAAVFLPQARAHLAVIDPLLPATTLFPKRMDHLDDYRLMARDLHERLGGDDTVAVFAASEGLTGDMLPGLDPWLKNRTAYAGEVDVRDGLQRASLEARFAVVTDPPALRFPEHEQQIISEPDRRILAGEGFGAAYARVAGPYRLEQGLTATLVERTRPLEDAEWHELCDWFRAGRPDWRDKGKVCGPDY